jgi:hypothetical protein
MKLYHLSTTCYVFSSFQYDLVGLYLVSMILMFKNSINAGQAEKNLNNFS